jgi:alpha-tubulin suppressor-like RCC1 family protein
VDSVAYCWGQGPWLGTGDTTNRNTPAPVAGGLKFATLSTGGYHACGVTAAGVAYCWGDNGGGALGDSTTIDRLTPVPVAGGLAWRVVVAAGNHGTDYSCGLTTNGVAYCWGSHLGGNSVTPVPVPGAPAFASITLGGVAHACGITPGGVTYCWGDNYGGALGDGSTTSSPTPVRVAGQP